jgi:hypothetical protein
MHLKLIKHRPENYSIVSNAINDPYFEKSDLDFLRML